MSWDDDDFNSPDPFIRFHAHQASKGRSIHSLPLDIEPSTQPPEPPEGYDEDGEMLDNALVAIVELTDENTRLREALADRASIADYDEMRQRVYILLDENARLREAAQLLAFTITDEEASSIGLLQTVRRLREALDQ